MRSLFKKSMAALAFALVVTACAGTVDQTTTTASEPQPTVTPPSTTQVDVGDPGIEPVVLSPTMDVERAVASAPPGTAFVFEPGIYRNVSIQPKDAMSFVAQQGATLNGSTIIDGFVRQEDVWVVDGITNQGRTQGNCEEDAPMCSRPEDIYIDSVLSQQVVMADEVGPGTFQLDYETGTLTIGDDPMNRLVELTTTEFAFFGTASDVTIDGFIIEKYANPAQSGAIQAKNGNDLALRWRVANNDVRYNHGVGIKLGAQNVIEQNRVYSNGQLGIGTGPGGFDNIIRDNEVYDNTTVGFLAGFETGGMKLTTQTRVTAERNYVHDNRGPGIWTDIDNIDVTIANNVVENNLGPGIFHEISYRAVIRDNTVTGNGFGWTQWLYGAGILIAHSRDVEVTGNVVKDNRLGIIGIQQDRGTGAYGERELRNLYVHDNIIVASEGSTGIGQDIGSEAVFSEWNNRFESNTYYVDTDQYFRWRGKVFDFRKWNEFGNDLDGETLKFEAFNK
jgi:parallel beta-helix repeat protein